MTGKYRKKLEKFGSLHPEIDLIYLFGSHAKGSAIKDSDLDIAILFNDSRNNNQLNYINEISRLLQMDDIDLLILNEANCLLSFQVLKHGRCIFSRTDKAKIEYETTTLRNYLDTAYLFSVHRKFVKKQLQQGDYFG